VPGVRAWRAGCAAAAAVQGFLGCKHFSATNKLLQDSGLPPIDWQIENV
jgi:uracil-DNA glycosylase